MKSERHVEMLAVAGRMLHGDEWQAPLARELGINRETIRRWLNGSAPLPAEHGVFDDLKAILLRRASEASEHGAAMARLAGLIDKS